MATTVIPTALTVETILDHHMRQNAGQKLTPHLILGLCVSISRNIKEAGLLAPVEAAPLPTTEEAK